MKKQIVKLLMSALVIGVLCGCGNTSQESTETTAQLEEEAAAEEAARIAEEAAAEAARIAEEEAAAEAARQEEANTYYENGRACLYGLDGQEIDLEGAYTNFEKALELGKTEANFYLGVLYDWYGYLEKNYEKAGEYYEADSDNPYAQIALGLLYCNGHGVEEDTEKAQEIFDTVIASGCVEGYYGSADIAYNNEDYDTALDCYNKVLEGDEQLYIATAMSQIGWMYQEGLGVEVDYDLAMEWYEKAADLGAADAMNNIGYMYQYELGVEQDYAFAMECFEKAADLGNATAMNNIGYMYHFELGVEQDYDLAMEWYEKAADLGDDNAMNNIGWMYENGQSVEQDYALAMEWYEKAADLGNKYAMQSIGILYFYGYGVEQDYATAYEWFVKAADLGNNSALTWVEGMKETGLIP